MKLHSAFTASLLLAVSNPAVVIAADPAPKPAAKPRMVPRPVPGLARLQIPGAAVSPSAVAPQATASSAPVVPPSDNQNQARILAIYRRGTFQPPATTPDPQSAEQPSPSVAAAQTKPVAPPAPGQFRILTQAEAASLVAPAPPSP